jgi:hypothetical protein
MLILDRTGRPRPCSLLLLRRLFIASVVTKL